MPLPFHWLFRRGTWIGVRRRCFPTEADNRRVWLVRIVTGLHKKGLADREITAAFKSHLGVTIEVRRGAAELTDAALEELLQSSTNGLQFFERFLASSTLKYRDFLKEEEAKRDAEFGAALRKAARDSSAMEELLKQRRAAQAAALPESKAPANTGDTSGAARGLYMGQMLNQQRETNEPLRNLNDLLGG